MIRKPIITILGHVDHGKTRLLDTIRNTTVIDREAGAITQAIGASIVPEETIQRICGKLLDSLGIKLIIPGLLFVDTPGHEAFTNLRKRGGNLADIAVVVIDINEGLKPQTEEAIQILKKYKTPFIIALNKIDLCGGWVKREGGLLAQLNAQTDQTQQALDMKLYEVVGKLAELGFESDRFDRVSDHTKQIALVPISAKFNIGIPELLMVLTGLVQKFLAKKLEVEVKGPAKGTILEVKDEKGLGITLDAIIYEGTLDVGDIIVIGNIGEPIVTKVKALFIPEPLKEMRDTKGKFVSVKHLTAAIGVKVAAQDIDNVVAGMPIHEATEDTLEQVKKDVQQEIEEVLIETDKEGIVVKADTLGSLEALLTLLHQKNIPIKRATIGKISKKDIMDAQANCDSRPEFGAIVGFNVGLDKEADVCEVKIFNDKVIYKLIEDFEKWFEARKKALETAGFDTLTPVCKMQIMPNHIFRRNNPAVVGMDILAGKARTGMRLMKDDGKHVTHIKSMELEKKSVKEVEAGKQLAVSLPGITIGRQLNEGDVLYTFMAESEFLALKKFKKCLSKDMISVMKDIADIMRKENPTWGL
ncbi:translation initiation factor IF-2 [Candidatus Woesearchaeota archaeon CG10_big_fil_rev_8_21_14_0_10_34_8]|nr:MAG: translation initiation factor IF-2 [Candidatus Woesearchaeota archaeon CG10_big_fil_rev_8_21_14_0_10_34_8]